jgi:predicted dehydrogenase
MVRIGIIGLGFMGMTHFEGATRLTDAPEPRRIRGSKLRGGKVVAIATRNAKKRAGDWTSIQGNFGPRGSHMDLGGIKTVADYRELLEDPNVDLIDVCLPTDQHEKVAIEAIRAGKHVLVEKPIAIDLKAAQRMVREAEKAGVLLMVAHVLPFFPEFRFALETAASGKYGTLRAAHFRRVMAPPDWSGDMSNFVKLGGWGIDLHIHDNHFVSVLAGVPQKVFSRGLLQDGFVNHVHTQYVYDDPDLSVSCVSGGIAARGLVFGHGFEIFLEDATLQFDAGTYGSEWVVNRPLTLMTNTKKGAVREPRPKGGTEWCAAFTGELQAAVDGVNSGQAPTLLSGQIARDALQVCYAEAKSIETGRLVPVRK